MKNAFCVHLFKQFSLISGGKVGDSGSRHVQKSSLVGFATVGGEQVRRIHS